MNRIMIPGARFAVKNGMAVAMTVAMTVALAVSAGCSIFEPSSMGGDGDAVSAPTEIKHTPSIETDPVRRAQITAAQLAEFSNLAPQLPGADEAAHRQLMERAFSALGQILPNIMGPNPDAAFRQQIPLIGAAPGRLRALPPADSSESVIETGMRATYLALDDIRGHYFADDATMSAGLDSMGNALDELETSHDAAHRQIVAQQLVLASHIMNVMNQTLTQRLSAIVPSTQQSPEPSPAPSTEPATQP